MAKEDDLHLVKRSEASRGSRKPLDLASLLEQKELREACRELLRPETTEKDFIEFMRAYGVPEEKFEAALKTWRAERRSSR